MNSNKCITIRHVINNRVEYVNSVFYAFFFGKSTTSLIKSLTLPPKLSKIKIVVEEPKIYRLQRFVFEKPLNMSPK